MPDNDDLPPGPFLPLPPPKSPALPSREAWKPTISDLIAFGAIVIAVGTWLIEPGWVIGIVLSLFVVALVVFAAFRHDSHIAIRFCVSALVLAGYFYFVSPKLWEDYQKHQSGVVETKPPANDARRLTDEQKTRLRKSLALAPDEHIYFSINSAPSCDECDQFADNLRQFIATIPGCQVDGGVMIVHDPSRHRGLWLTYRSSNAESPAVQKVMNAFQDAGMPLQSEINENLRPAGAFILGVYRPGP